MQHSTYSIHYDIVPNPTGFTLQIWEFKPTRSQAVREILYKLNYRVASVEVAWGILNQHLEISGVAKLSPPQLKSSGGKIKMVPNPTLALKIA